MNLQNVIVSNIIYKRFKRKDFKAPLIPLNTDSMLKFTPVHINVLYWLFGNIF